MSYIRKPAVSGFFVAPVESVVVLHRDVIFLLFCFSGERRKVLNWLLSYNPLWLRIGLEVFCYDSVFFCFLMFVFPTHVFTIHPEHNVTRSQTIYGELISLESNSDTLGLAMFILQRLLWNPDIAAEFRHAKVPHLYKEGNPTQVLSELTLLCVTVRVKEMSLRTTCFVVESSVIEGIFVLYRLKHKLKQE